MMRPRLPAAALPLVLIACGGSSDGADDPPPPSIILISLDTLRAGHMSLYGYERETTPFLEELAQESLVFDRATSVAPWTLISHVTMLTGLYPEQHGVVEDDLALSPDSPLIAQRLQDYGYRTFGLYKPGWVGPRHGEDRGFDVFVPHEVIPEAEEHMADLPPLTVDQPYFFFLHLFDIHSDPLRGPDSLKYDPPEPYDTLFMEDAKARLRSVDFIKANAGLTKLDEEELEAMVSLYDAKIRYVDDTLRRWFQEWRDAGALDNTLVIITSDHGESLGQRDGRISGHGHVWQDALHIPMIVRFPDGHRAGEREDALVSLVDVVPTVLEAVRLPTDPRLPGMSLRAEPPADRVVGAYRPPYYARLQLPWKVRGSRGSAQDVNHLLQDPGETNRVTDRDLFFQVSGDVEQAFQAVLDACAPLDAPPIPAIDLTEEARADLEAFGYGGGNEDE